MSTTTCLIIDFDGVLVDSMPEMATFISQKLRISQKSAFARILRYSLSNKHSWISERIKKSQSQKYLKFLQTQPRNLVNESMLAVLAQINLPKAILTTNYSFLCEAILKDFVQDFQHVIGFDKVTSKTKGLEFLFAQPGFDASTCLLVTDTLGDIVEFQKSMPTEQILGAGWGFCPQPILGSVLPEKQILQTPQDLLKFVN